MTDTEILNFLDDYLSYQHTVGIFGEKGIGADGGPASLRSVVEYLNSPHE